MTPLWNVVLAATVMSLSFLAPIPALGTASVGAEFWVGRFNSAVDGSDEAYAMAVSPDGTHVFVTGYSDRMDGFGIDLQYVTVAYDAGTGARLWLRRYDGAPGCTDSAEAIAASADGTKVFVTGFSGCLGKEDYATVAYEANSGQRLWVSRYDGPTGDPDEASTVTSSPDGTSVFVSGRSFGRIGEGRDYATIAYDATSGEERWVRRYNGPGISEEEGHDEASALAVSPDGSTLFVTGASFGIHSDWDYATLAYDTASGQTLWVGRYNGPTDLADLARAVVVSPDGTTVFVAGYTYGHAFSDYATLAYDAATGEQRWIRRYDGPSDGYDFADDASISPDGTKVFVTGYSDGVGSSTDFATLSYDAASGERLWLKRYDGPAHDSDTARAIAVSPDGTEVFVAGWSFGLDSTEFPFDFATVAYDAVTGQKRWANRYNGPSNGMTARTISWPGPTVPRCT